MSDVQFDEPTEESYNRPTEAKKPSLFERMVYATKLSNDPKGAQRILLIAAIVFFALSILLFLI